MDWETLTTILVSLGGWEAVKYFINRKANKTMATANAALAEAEAQKASVQVEHDKFDLFEEINTHLQEGLVKKDEVIASKDRVIEEKDRQFAEQTKRLRKTQDELNAALKENTELKAKYIYADTWRCELGACKKRKPPKPQLYGLEYDENKMPITPKENKE